MPVQRAATWSAGQSQAFKNAMRPRRMDAVWAAMQRGSFSICLLHNRRSLLPAGGVGLIVLKKSAFPMRVAESV